MDDSINISIPKRSSSKVKAFEKKEWTIADLEHYGAAQDFLKKHFKFVASNKAGDVIGILDLIITANVAFIDALLVGSKYQGQGVGRKLITEAENFAKKKKCTKVWLETDADWDAAKFYKKVGYKVTGTQEKHMLNKKGLIYTKFL